MPKWAKSLIRLSTFEVETLQKRLAEVVTRRTHIEMRIATLDAEYELECLKAAADAGMAYSLTAYKRGFKLRRDQMTLDIDLIVQEENGVRDQLSLAFEDLKKFEHVADITKLRREAAARRVENAAMDEAAQRSVRGSVQGTKLRAKQA